MSLVDSTAFWFITNAACLQFVDSIRELVKLSPITVEHGGFFTLAFRVTRILVLFTYFFKYFSFSCERKLCGEHKARRCTTFQLTTFPSALSIRRLIVGRFAIATTHPPTSAEDSSPPAGTICRSYVLFLFVLFAFAS